MKVYRVKLTEVRENIVEVEAQNARHAVELAKHGDFRGNGIGLQITHKYEVLNDWENTPDRSV